jgi:hypothetical protein
MPADLNLPRLLQKQTPTRTRRNTVHCAPGWAASGVASAHHGWIAMISMPAVELLLLAVAVCVLLPAGTGPTV